MSFHLQSLSSDLTPWIDPLLSPQRFTIKSQKCFNLLPFTSLFLTEIPFPLVSRIAYLGLRDVDPPEQAVLESLGIASYYTQVINNNENDIITF